MSKKINIALFSTRDIGRSGLFQNKELRTKFQSQLLYKYFVPFVDDTVWNSLSSSKRQSELNNLGKKLESVKQELSSIEDWCKNEGIYSEKNYKLLNNLRARDNQLAEKYADLKMRLKSIDEEIKNIEEGRALNSDMKLEILCANNFPQERKDYICNLDNDKRQRTEAEKEDPWFEYRFSLFRIEEESSENFVYAVWPLVTAAKKSEEWYEALVDEIMSRHAKDNDPDLNIEIYLILHDKDINLSSPEKFIESHKEFSWKEKIKYKRTIAIFQHVINANPIYSDVIKNGSLSPDDIIKELEKRTDAKTTELGTQSDLEDLSKSCVVAHPKDKAPFLEKIRKINEELKKIL